VTSLKGLAQDKLFLRNGTQLKCKIVAISENTISYRDTIPDSPLITVPKNDILIAEYKTGNIYIFGNTTNQFQVVNNTYSNETREQRKERKMKEWKETEQTLSNNILGFYIPELILGRFTVSYERLLANKSMGVKVPVSLTYNTFGYVDSNSSSSTSTNTNNTVAPKTGVGFITGIDVNYYHDLKPELKYYFGPRIRYGTDMILGGIEGLTVQLQNGIFRSRGKRFTSTLGVGFGFFKLSEKYSNYGGYEPKQVYPWASFTWRMGFRL
jgi:hypothetical protein